MKKLISFFICSSTLILPFNLYADNSASTNVSVSGNVIASLSITSVEPIRFGEIAAAEVGTLEPTAEVSIDITDQSTGAFTVAYGTSNSPDVSETNLGTLNIPASGNRSTISPGVINVSGETGYHYIAAFDNSGFFSGGVTRGVILRALFSTSSGSTNLSRTIGSGGTDKIYVGGQFSATKGSPVGSITSGTVNVVVTYD